MRRKMNHLQKEYKTKLKWDTTHAEVRVVQNWNAIRVYRWNGFLYLSVVDGMNGMKILANNHKARDFLKNCNGWLLIHRRGICVRILTFLFASVTSKTKHKPSLVFTNYVYAYYRSCLHLYPQKPSKAQTFASVHQLYTSSIT